MLTLTRGQPTHVATWPIFTLTHGQATWPIHVLTLTRGQLSAPGAVRLTRAVVVSLQNGALDARVRHLVREGEHEP